MTHCCPPIDVLMDDPAAAAEHVEQCPACRGVAGISALRGFEQAARSSSDECIDFEPLVAAMAAGTIGEAEVPLLISHLQSCASCNEVLASLSLLGDELSRIPDPGASLPGGVGSRSAPEPPRVTPSAWGRLVPRRPWVWALQLAAAVLLGAVMAHWLPSAGEPASPAALGPDQDTVPSAEPGAVPAGPGPASRPPRGHRADQVDLIDPWSQSSTPPAPHAGAAASGGAANDGTLIDPWSKSSGSGRGSAGSGQLIDPFAHRPSQRLLRAPDPADIVDPWRSQRARPIAPRSPDPFAARPPGSIPEADLVDPFKPRRDTSTSSPPGRLNLNCRPAYCEAILVDGKNLGSSPIVQHQVAPGPHQLVFRRGQTVRRRSVVVASGKTVSVVVRME